MKSIDQVNAENFSRQGRKIGRRGKILGIFSLLTVTAMLVTPFISIIRETAAASLTRSVIIQLNGDPAAVWKAKQQKAGINVSDSALQSYRESVTASQNSFLADLRNRGVNYTIDGVDIPDFAGAKAGHADFRFNLVLNGLTLVVPNSAINIIKSMPQVKSVRPNSVLNLHLNKSVPYINAPAVYGAYPELTQFDTQREGYEGQGMYVAVLDTGIDWKHEMFGGDPTPPRLGIAPPVAAVGTNQKVVYYLPLTGGYIDDYGHGTAASSDIAGYLGFAPGADGLPGTADDIRVHGVAPQARLMAYKVCLGVGSCVSASTILGLEDAVSPVTLTLQPKPVAHVVNMSLGGSGTPDDDTAVAADNAALMGTIVVASAGNEGPGEGTVGSPSVGRHVISVAASTDPGAANQTWSADVLQASSVPLASVGAVTPASGFATQSGFDRIKLYKMAESPDPAAGAVAQHYVMIDLADIGATYPASTAGRIALIKDSGLASGTFFDICNNAAANGAIAALLISDTFNATALKSLIPCAVVSPDDGAKLIDAISSTDDNAIDPANGAVSELPIRINPYLRNVFRGDTASFSSRGPVVGLGQVKPDVTAPGVDVLSATVRTGVADANGGHMFDPTGYTLASGTSFSGPHVSGAVTLIKQAHLDWSVDYVRTALINTATNMRSVTGTPEADGSASDSLFDQGGGLVDVGAAVNTKAIMGVEGDGVVNPSILGSHSFGEKPILNNRVNNSFDVDVVIRDVSGQGGTYTLATANNRATTQAGFATGTSVLSVTVPAGGSASFKATISVNGDTVRATDIQDAMWYVIATDPGGKKLRMPMYLKATPSLPGDSVASSETTTYTGTVNAGDAGVQRDQDLYLVDGGTYTDVKVTVPSTTLKLDGTLNFSVVQDVPGLTGLPDLDFLLFDPNGDKIGESAGSTGTEHIAANTTIPGEYTWRVYGFIAANTEFTLQSTQLKGGGAPTVQPFASDFTQGGTRTDFDGNLTLSWTPNGQVDAYEIEQSTDGTNWSVLGQMPGNATSAALSNVSEGNHNYRIRAITPGRIGKFVSNPSNVESVTVSRRSEVDATDAISAINRTITFGTGTVDIISALKNTSANIYYPNLRFEIISISSAGNSVRVSNADNGGDGVSTTAAFDYSQLVGVDFTAGEESGNKTLRFSNPNTVMFTFTARVKANVATGGSATGGGTTAGSTGGTGTGGSTGGSIGGGINGATPKLLKFTVNPLTRTISLLN